MKKDKYSLSDIYFKIEALSVLKRLLVEAKENGDICEPDIKEIVQELDCSINYYFGYQKALEHYTDINNKNNG